MENEMNDKTEVAARPNYVLAIGGAKKSFNEINKINNLVDYTKEARFATQQIEKNDYLMKIANNNPQSLVDAVVNVAMIGLTLNPADKFAYIVPRNGAACLDISYIGFIKLATDTGSIMWARAELIHENDDFIYHGATERPEFATKNPFSRGPIVGVYCVAKTKEGDYLSGIMSIDECHKIRDKSESFKKSPAYSPWTTFEGEMIKKTIIKRESKTWPKTDKSERFDEAVHIANEHEGIDFSRQVNPEPINMQKVEQAYVKAIEIVDIDDFDIGAPMATELFQSLTQDEQITLTGRLRNYKPDKRKYSTLFREYLEYVPDEPVITHQQ
jgi:recombination protein RecT